LGNSSKAAAYVLKTFQDSYVQLNPHLDRNNVHRSLEDMEQLDNEFRIDEKLAFARGVFDVERFESFFVCLCLGLV